MNSSARLRSGISALFALSLPSPAFAQHMVERVSLGANGEDGNGDSGTHQQDSLSADGRFIVFVSSASNLVAGDTNGMQDVFVTDRVTHVTRRMSLDSAGHQATLSAWNACISTDGRFVFFSSDAPNLVASDSNGATDVFVRDRDPDGNGVFDEGNETTERVSVASDGSEGDGRSELLASTPDGRFVVFSSGADDLVTSDTNGKFDVFLRDRVFGTTTRVSVDSAGAEGDGDCATWAGDITPDGSCIAFLSRADNLVPNGGNGFMDVYVRDVALGVTTRISTDPAGNDGDGDCYYAELSDDGNLVAFISYADNLVANDTNLTSDLFLHDRQTGSTSLQSVSTAGIQGDGQSNLAVISGDGRFLMFASVSTNLVPGYTRSHQSDTYLRDLSTGITTCESVNCAEVIATGSTEPAAISYDGSMIVMSGWAIDLTPGDDNWMYDVFFLDPSIPDPVASWSNYGAGFPGSNGIPALAPTSDPVVGDPLSVTVDNSTGPWTVGLLIVGTGQTSFVTRAGGTWLVDPIVILTTFPVAPGGTSFDATLPAIPDICGTSLFLQVLELDVGAAYGISFTAGLELTFGV